MFKSKLRTTVPGVRNFYRGKTPLLREIETTESKVAEKGAKAALLVAIVIVSSLLVLASSPPKAPQNQAPPPVSPNPVRNQQGTLEISVTVINLGNTATVLPVSIHFNSTTISSGSSFVVGVPGNFTAITAIIPPALSPVTFTAIGVGLSQAPLRLNVTQPGQAVANTSPGLYQVFTRNEYYSLSLYAQVLPNSTTNVQVSLNQSLVPAVFTQIEDLDSLGIVQPWEPVTIHVPGLTGAAPGRNIFIVYGTSSSLGCPSTCLVSYSSVLAKVLQVDLRSNGAWLVVSLQSPVSVQTLQDVSIRSLSASYKVITNAA